jgi:uncharacterized protein (TIGR03067 family)
MARIAVIVLILLAPAFVPAADPARRELATLQGPWKMVSIKIGDRVFKYPEASQPRWLVKGNQLVNPRTGKSWATISVDPATTPKTLDLTHRDSRKVMEGVYALDQDTWTIAINPTTDGVKERPTDFSNGRRADWKVWVLRREKP